MTTGRGDVVSVRTNGVTLSVLDGGGREREAVLLLHGFPEGRLAWRHQIGPLRERGFRAVAPSLLGYDESDKPEDVRRYRLDALVNDVLGLADALVGPSVPVSIVGHDWGGVLAWRLAADAPDRVRRLVVLNAPMIEVWRRVVPRSLHQCLKSWYVLAFQVPWLPEWIAGLGNAWLLGALMRRSARPGTFSSAELDLYRRAWSGPGALRAMIHWYRANVGAALREPPRIAVPALILWGERDVALTSALATASLARCERGTLLLFPEATHWLQHDEPEIVSRLIAGFLADEDVAAIGRSAGARAIPSSG